MLPQERFTALRQEVTNQTGWPLSLVIFCIIFVGGLFFYILYVVLNKMNVYSSNLHQKLLSSIRNRLPAFLGMVMRSGV